MTHYHAEIVIPPCPRSDVLRVVAKVLEPFDQDPVTPTNAELWAKAQAEEGPGERSNEEWFQLGIDYSADREVVGRDAWWDRWRIGGRWAGEKTLGRFPRDQIDAFYSRLVEAKITISIVQMGKETLDPFSQAPKVDRMWREAFPDGGDVCPLFSHYPVTDDDNICTVGELPDHLLADRLLIAIPWRGGEWETRRMLQTSLWNGVDWCESTWDGNVKDAVQRDIEELTERASTGRGDPQWFAEATPTDDWQAITLDYHS